MSSKSLKIDPRFIYLAVMLSIAIPILFPLGLPISISESSRQTYEAITAVPEGGYVIFSVGVNYDAKGEMIYMLQDLIKHNLQLGNKVILLTFNEAQDSAIAEEAMLAVMDDNGGVYGENIVHLGFLAGLEASMSTFATDVRAVVNVDYYGTPVDDLPIMDGLRNWEDMDLILMFAIGGDQPQGELRQFNTPYGIPVSGGSVAGIYANIVPFINSGQLSGYLNGLKGTAEYELIMEQPGEAVLGMDAQSLMSLTVIVFIILGNFGTGKVAIISSKTTGVDT